MQLVAYGAQDVYLTGNPQITFFKVVYRRHTNFSMESIRQTMNGGQGANGRGTVTISRNGDLVMGVHLEVNNSATLSRANPLHAIIDHVELEIGGQKIDKHHGHWLETYAQLTQPNEKGVVGRGDALAGDHEGQVLSPFAGGTLAAVKAELDTEVVKLRSGTLYQRSTGTCGVDASGLTTGVFNVPLQFWFCRNPGLALPLIALQYHEVKVNLQWSGQKTTSQDVTVYCDYVYLDTDERRRFAQVSHEYLIEQVQFQAHTSVSADKELNFNHPVKELIWTGSPNSGGVATVATKAPADVVHLKLNGHERMAPRSRNYFTRHQVRAHHSGFGGVNVGDSIAVYSFALKPEEHQPSGTCNFSRIDNARLILSDTHPIHVYAVNYNVLRIMSGMGGLAYSN